MRAVCKVQVNWESLRDLLVPRDCLVEGKGWAEGGKEVEVEGNTEGPSPVGAEGGVEEEEEEAGREGDVEGTIEGRSKDIKGDEAEEATVPKKGGVEGGKEGPDEGGMEGGAREVWIKYEGFLESFQVQNRRAKREGQGAQHVFDALYVNRRQLEALFAFFDKDGDGSISREEFCRGCEVVNGLVEAEGGAEGGGEGGKILEVDRVLELLDADRNEAISVNEFFEAFRLLDSKDGRLDGRLGEGGGEGGGEEGGNVVKAGLLIPPTAGGAVEETLRRQAMLRRASSKLVMGREGRRSSLSMSR
ncbi:protein phosphatase-7 [Nannochloropsis gaditana]|uniref:Protein phosphatase-7 n=1 Tax=Nannochloropsis gaditana TaxID=72520 RepID=W7TR53_9STRA|nr:protein phosphatase-7 [Nannochloropsis gaditana]